MDKAYSIESIEHIIFDIDSINLKTFGKQHGAAFNYHYGSKGYHSLLMANLNIRHQVGRKVVE